MVSIPRRGLLLISPGFDHDRSAGNPGVSIPRRGLLLISHLVRFRLLPRLQCRCFNPPEGITADQPGSVPEAWRSSRIPRFNPPEGITADQPELRERNVVVQQPPRFNPPEGITADQPRLFGKPNNRFSKVSIPRRGLLLISRVTLEGEAASLPVVFQSPGGDYC